MADIANQSPRTVSESFSTAPFPGRGTLLSANWNWDLAVASLGTHCLPNVGTLWLPVPCLLHAALDPASSALGSGFPCRDRSLFSGLGLPTPFDLRVASGLAPQAG